MKLPIIAAAALVLAGCGGISAHPRLPATSYAYQAAQYVGHGRALPIEVQGNPFAAPRDGFAADVAASMQGHARGTAPKFVPAADGAGGPYRVVIAFSPQNVVRHGDLCEGTMPTGVPGPGETLEAVAEFCQGSRMLSASAGTAPMMAGPDTPEFQTLMARLTASLFPRRDPDRDECGAPWLRAFCDDRLNPWTGRASAHP